ncbi:hypothetical protein FB45DRAFT_748480 [Roridomyces roridus]|uniref:FAD-binding PCMH-type domain-containing protein n=1 Tax=Roridomyces roridus TaxID=1738132 RepID=A0AAD7BRZ6_9AGAR|nr:hypothetical protein FB45DRAFT_748480 [Roridomyces roridus]
MQAIAEVSGPQFLPDSAGYHAARDQYATSSRPEAPHLFPGLIVQPHDEADIQRVIAYANTHHKAIAIRSGGHQYSGASSTSSDNIQINLRSTFRHPEDLVFVEKGPFVRISVSYNILEFNTFLRQNNVFVPHGQCSSLHLGGQVQTGGYGQLTRSFGLLGDHVVSLEIIDFNGEKREITRANDPELFFAWLGGSPGNLGVLTHVSIKVHRDADHTGSIGLLGVHIYDPAKLRTLLGHVTQMSDDPYFPRNYDVCITVVSERDDNVLSKMSVFDDDEIRKSHPQLFALPATPPVIVVFAQYVCLGPDVAPDMEWFQRFRAGSVLSRQESRPVSELMSWWIFPEARAYPLPYVNRGYVSHSRTLAEGGKWADWMVGRIHGVIKENNGLFAGAQVQPFGGKYSMLGCNAGNGTAYSWRDMTLCMSLNVFYKPESRTAAEEWAQTNDQQAFGPSGMVSPHDHRLLWASYGTIDLASVWQTYYEDGEKYERLKRARGKADPNGIFTPNAFCVPRGV